MTDGREHDTHDVDMTDEDLTDEDLTDGDLTDGDLTDEDLDAEDVVEVDVPSTLAGVRVDRAVAMLADVSRARASELILGGAVSVDALVVGEGRVTLREGARLRVVLPPLKSTGPLPEAGVDFGVVYEDDDVVVVDKPAGLVVHPGAGHTSGTLVSGLLARYPDVAALVDAGICDADRPGIVHRLDKGTSGLLAVARTPRAFASLVAQLAARSMTRQYLALVEGIVLDDAGQVDAPIGRSVRTPTKMTVASGGKPAVTSYRVLERREEPRPTSLLELRLESGRTHQIRVHMAAIGHPVVGDARYGKADRRLPPGRFFLHAARLSFRHPVSDERVEFSSPLPDDLKGLL